jgi:hypothetical protein
MEICSRVDPVISSVVRNLVLRHPKYHLSYGQRALYERRNTPVEDEISRYARNDRSHLWVLVSFTFNYKIIFCARMNKGKAHMPWTFPPFKEIGSMLPYASKTAL